MTAHAHFRTARSLQSCGNCDAFVRGRAPKRPGEPVQGYCHAGTPHLVQMMQQGQSLSATGPVMVPVSIPNVWPPVTDNEWCRAWHEQGDDDDGSAGTA